MNEPIISVSGLRGIIGETLTPEVAIRYTAAFLENCPPGPIVVSRDSRPSGAMLRQAVLAAVTASGRQAIDAGILATPTLGVLIRHLRAAGGIQITASHNPPQYNGLKLFNSTGRVLPNDHGARVLQSYQAGKPRFASYDKVGSAARCDQGNQVHLEAILALVNVSQIRQKRFRVLLDANGGAGGPLAKLLLEQLGCEVVAIGSDPTGHFAHPPEPVPSHLEQIRSQVVKNRCQVGFCQDPDADRLALIDADGRCLSEEYTLAICAKHVVSKNPGPIVANCATSRITEHVAKELNVPFVRTAVGEANVVDGMLAHEAAFGGEGNGGPIDPRVGLVRDSFVGMALVLDAMAENDATLAELAAQLPPCNILKTKVTLPREAIPGCLEKLQKHFSDATVDRIDGVRLDWPDRWLLVRPSNTEPIVRVIAEGSTPDISQQLCKQTKELMELWSRQHC